MKQLIRDEVAPWIEEAITGTGILDTYTYEVALNLIAVPQLVDGQMVQSPQPMLVVLVAVPNPVQIGGKISAATMLPGFPSQPEVTVAMHSIVDQLATSRAEILKAAPALQLS